MRTGPKTERLNRFYVLPHNETELGDHDFYLSRSHEKKGKKEQELDNYNYRYIGR